MDVLYVAMTTVVTIRTLAGQHTVPQARAILEVQTKFCARLPQVEGIPGRNG